MTDENKQYPTLFYNSIKYPTEVDVSVNNGPSC